VKKLWFLPEMPDVMATLREQGDITVEAASAFTAWAGGDQAQQLVVRDCEHRADTVKRALSMQLRAAFSTPIDQEDLFTLSERLDVVLNAVKNVVREAEAISTPPDAVVEHMASELEAGLRLTRQAFDQLALHGDQATKLADQINARESAMEKIYRAGMQALSSGDDVREIINRRELYRRTLETGERMARVADRIWYAVVKEA